MVDSNLDQLFTVNVTTGAATLIGSTLNNGLVTPADLTWRAATQQLWTIDLAGGEVGTLDVDSGTFSPVFIANPTSGWQGMAWSEPDGVFYLANQDGNNYVLDPATGVTTLLGAAGVGLIVALDVDAANVLYGVDLNGAVVSINKVSGAATTIANTLAGFQGLGINHRTGVWFGANVNDDSLHTIVPTTGASTLIGAFGLGTQFSKGFDLVEKTPDAYLVDAQGHGLFAIELSTGTATLVGNTMNNGLSVPTDVAYRAATGQLWTIDLSGGEVGTLDLNTAVFTPIYNAVPNAGWQGIAWSEVDGVFFLGNQDGNTYVLDPLTGATTVLGPSGSAASGGLDTDAFGNLYAVSFSGVIASIDKGTGLATQIATTASGTQDLAIDQVTGRWYVVNSLTNSLSELQKDNGMTTLVGAFGAGVQFPRGFDLVDKPRSFLVDSNLDVLCSVDLLTGVATTIASTNNNGLATPADLTFRSDTNTLWTVDLTGGAVGTLDMATAAFTPAYQTGLSGFQAIAYDQVTQSFYLANQNGNTYRLDPRSGVTTLLGATGYALITCLDTDGAGNLFGIDFNTGAIVSIDKVTGAGSTLSTTITGFQGLGIDWVSGVWFGSNTNDDSLHFVASATGANILIGAHGAGVGFAKGFDVVDTVGTTPATNARFGNACGGVGLNPLTRPVLGRHWEIDVNLPPAGLLGGIGIGFTNPSLSLAPFGAPGCTQYSDSTALVILLLPIGSPAYSLEIPADSSFVGLQLFAQGYGYVPGANPLNLGASRGLRGQIGNF